MTTLLIFFLGAGLLLVLLALPLLFEKVPPNPLYGFRVAATLGNERIWYATNRYAAKRLIVCGLSIAAAAIVLRAIPGIAIDAYALGCLAVFVVVFGVTLVQSVRYMRQIGRGQAGV